LKLRWHLFWIQYHYDMGTWCFRMTDHRGAHEHYTKLMDHLDRYRELGGELDDPDLM
jgi:hypothetical protein